MMLSELSAVSDEELPVQEFKEHLRLGSGFADGAVQDGLIRAHLHAAIVAVEARTGKVLLGREFQWELEAWREAGHQALPLAPVTEVISVQMIDRFGEARVVPQERWRLVRDTHRPKLAATGFILPGIPTAGRVQIQFRAGFGSWSEVPADLRQAVLMLSAQYYEDRPGTVAMPAAVMALVERWRIIRTFGGMGR